MKKKFSSLSKKVTPDVSVIIPMYNTEKYIEKCLDSLLNQSLENIEVIVVDDCSTDNSLELAEKFIPSFESKNKKLTTITFTQNSGYPGIPRNFALDIAKGKYVYFMDSDDFLSEDLLEIFYNAAEKFKADVVDANMTLEYEEINGKFETKAKVMQNAMRVEQPTLETSDVEKRIDNVIAIRYFNTVWSKFFRREFLIRNNIKFPAMTITEDLVFMLQYIVLAKNYVRIPFAGYFYRKYQGSTSQSNRDIKMALLDFIEGVHFLDNFMQSQKFFQENPKYQYRIIDFLDQWFSDKIFKFLFFDMNLEPEVAYNVLFKEVFKIDPQKNIPLANYLFTSTNIYKMLVKQQSEEIAHLKKLLIEAKKLMEVGE